MGILVLDWSYFQAIFYFGISNNEEFWLNQIDTNDICMVSRGNHRIDTNLTFWDFLIPPSFMNMTYIL